MQAPPANFYEFGAFQLDPVKRLLRRLDGTPVPLTPRVFDTLLFMVEHHDSVLDKERIMEAVWPDSIVEENNLAQAIWKLRQVFGETPGSHSYIVTIPGRGYRFVADVNERTTTVVAPQHSDTADAAAVSNAKPAPANALIETPSPDASITQRRPTPWPRRTKTAWLWATGALLAVAVIALAGLFFGRDRSLPALARTVTSPVPAGTTLFSPA